jgi:hypothetical protein
MRRGCRLGGEIASIEMKMEKLLCREKFSAERVICVPGVIRRRFLQQSVRHIFLKYVLPKLSDVTPPSAASSSPPVLFT